MPRRLVLPMFVPFATAMLIGSVAHAADPSFVLKVDVPPTHHGEKSVVRVHLTPGAGYHMNKEFPTSLSMIPADGVSVEKPKQTAKDATRMVEEGADFDVTLTAAAAGKKVLTGDLKFAVCSATSCDPKKEKLSFTVEVK